MKKSVAIAGLGALGVCFVAFEASAQTPAEVMARLEALASGEYAARVEAERAHTPVVRWSQSQIRDAARQAVLDELRDPPSARFRNVRRLDPINGTTTFCGEVSARNGRGGYSDFVRFESGVTDRGRASAQFDSRDVTLGSYFQTTWNQFCGRNGGVPVQF